METPNCDSPLEDLQGQAGDPVELVVSSAGGREDLEDSTSQHPEEPRVQPKSSLQAETSALQRTSWLL